MSHSRVFSSVQGLAADVGYTMTLGDPKGPAGVRPVALKRTESSLSHTAHHAGAGGLMVLNHS